MFLSIQEIKGELILAIQKSIAVLGIEETKSIIERVVDTKKQVEQSA